MHSMWPLILPSDSIASLKKQTKYQVDDIVVFMSGTNLIAHRIIYIFPGKQYCYLTRGDNNLDPDGRVASSHILGKVITIKRQSKIISLDSLYLSQATKYLGELTKFKQLSTKYKLPFIILKGIPVYRKFTQYYPKHFIYDLDILINKSDLPKVERTLRDLNYKIIPYLSEATEFSATKMLGKYPLSFDIHFEPTIAFSKASTFNLLLPQIESINQELWSTTHNHFLSTNHQFIYLLLHAFHHSFLGTKRWDYIDRFLSLKTLDIQQVLRLTAKLHLEDLIYSSLSYYDHYYQMPTASRLIKELKPSFTAVILTYVTKNLVKPWAPYPHFLNRLILMIQIFFLSPLPIYKKLYNLFYSIIFFDFKIFKKPSTSSLA